MYTGMVIKCFEAVCRKNSHSFDLLISKKELCNKKIDKSMEEQTDLILKNIFVSTLKYFRL